MPAAASGKFFFSTSFQMFRRFKKIVFVVLAFLSPLFTPDPRLGETTKPRKNKTVEGTRSAQIEQVMRGRLHARCMPTTVPVFSVCDYAGDGILLKLTEEKSLARSARNTQPTP